MTNIMRINIKYHAYSEPHVPVPATATEASKIDFYLRLKSHRRGTNRPVPARAVRGRVPVELSGIVVYPLNRLRIYDCFDH